MYIQTALRCRRAPSIFDGFNELSEAELAEALKENEQIRQGRKSATRSSAVANRFLKSAEVSSSAIWRSAAERRHYRQQTFAYQTRFGQPMLFVTLTPNSDNSFVTVQYSGGASELPSRIETRKATMGDDAASARLLMRQMDAFVKDVLGLDPVINGPKPFKGLLGEVRAYFGMVETQGRGTLHGHFLIWLCRCPPNAESFEKQVATDSEIFLNEVAQYADSTNQLPIPLDSGNCVNCGKTFATLVSLPIPVKARENIVGRFVGRRVPPHIRELLLVSCCRCNAQFSSQHALRRLLLMN
ncbi:hypothetical protein JG687_00015629 [Phytophthora cactorum]|uniref:Helitron helicase-like domain-containing protein n=1 Tax=Phytophthora cactorum TaxID=29920 RepID=A0A8T1TWF4_9STRA|nr:hypothetical protein JG687_00015629 [Phytophthora cactorum]